MAISIYAIPDHSDKAEFDRLAQQGQRYADATRQPYYIVADGTRLNLFPCSPIDAGEPLLSNYTVIATIAPTLR